MLRMEIKLSETCDIDAWMRLAEQVKGSFPGLEAEEAMAVHEHFPNGWASQRAR